MVGVANLDIVIHLNITGSHHAGTWECAEGLSAWDFSNGGEVIYVTAGKMTVTREGEAPQGPGGHQASAFASASSSSTSRSAATSSAVTPNGQVSTSSP